MRLQSLLLRTFCVCATLSILSSLGCGKKETAGTPEATSAAPKEIKAEPIAKPANLKAGLKVTTFPNNRFAGPGETTTETNTLGFGCDANPYNNKEVSLRYQGYLTVDQDDTYDFSVRSDDQAKLKVGQAVVVDNEQSTHTTEGSIKLKAGLYPLTVDYQNNVGAACLVVNWKSAKSGNVWTPIPVSQLSHD